MSGIVFDFQALRARREELFGSRAENVSAPRTHYAYERTMQWRYNIALEQMQKAYVARMQKKLEESERKILSDLGFERLLEGPDGA